MLAFITVRGRDVRVWSAFDRSRRDEFLDITDSDITCIALDHRERKLIVGCHDGAVGVFNLMNGALMKRGEKHDLEVTSVVYSPHDHVLMSVAWDHSLHVHDESQASEMRLLRSVANAHPDDIEAVAFYYDIGIVLTGAAGGVCPCGGVRNCDRMACGFVRVCARLCRYDGAVVGLRGVQAGGHLPWRAPRASFMHRTADSVWVLYFNGHRRRNLSLERR